ncbi:MAG TPA: flagellin [Candidatus Baltobacteraceae bacterium]|jgi:flagellin|nr:flagellin [Candidatus Baltobacteraceae bacterium]
MVINTNIAALTSANNLNNSTSMLNQALAELSSGSQLVSASDNPADLAESISLNAQINQVGAANDNVSNSNSFAQTQDGYLQQVGSALQQMSQLAVQAQDGTQSTTQLADDQKEFAALASFISNAATQNFNGVSLFSGSSMTVTSNGTGGTFTLSGVSLSASVYSNLANTGDNNISTTTGAATALTNVTAAITQLGTDRATVGANELSLNYTGQELQVLQTNLSAANSTIADVNVATESTAYAKYQILVQSGTSMLAQANQDPQLALKLLGD